MNRRRRSGGRSGRSNAPHDPEKDVQWKIRETAEILGFQVDDMTQPRGTMMPRGLPDLRLRHKPKRFRCWVEVKTLVGRLSPEQIGWHEFERACGGIVIVANSVESFLEGLEEAGFPIHSQ